MPTVANLKYTNCKKAMPEPYRLCEVVDDKHRLHIAEYDSFWKNWFDEDGKPIYKIWLWCYLENPVPQNSLDKMEPITCNVS